MNTKTFIIGGIVCGGCARTLEKIMRIQPGVKAAEFDFDRKEAVIVYGEDFEVSELKKAVNAFNYSIEEK